MKSYKLLTGTNRHLLCLCSPFLQNAEVEGGQTLYLTAPAFARFNPHPFSVVRVERQGCATGSAITGTAAVQQPERLVCILQIKATGPWSRALRQHALQCPDSPLLLQVRLLDSMHAASFMATAAWLHTSLWDHQFLFIFSVCLRAGGEGALSAFKAP